MCARKQTTIEEKQKCLHNEILCTKVNLKFEFVVFVLLLMVFANWSADEGDGGGGGGGVGPNVAAFHVYTQKHPFTINVLCK